MVRFIECMTPFYNVAKTEFSDVRKLKGEMEILYHDLETYFCFDQKKYQLHLFMRDIKTFKDQFKVKKKGYRNQLYIKIITGK